MYMVCQKSCAQVVESAGAIRDVSGVKSEQLQTKLCTLVRKLIKTDEGRASEELSSLVADSQCLSDLAHPT